MIGLAKAYYPSGDSFKAWTADMVGGLSITGTPNQYVTITHGSTNQIGYRLVASRTFIAAWQNSRALWMISSRHTGTGIVSIEAWSADSTTANGSIAVFSALGQFTGKIVGYKNGASFNIYLYMQDYNQCHITPLMYEYDTALAPKNGTWTTSTPAGTLVPANVNGKQIFVQSSQPTESEAVLWIQT